MDRSSSRHWLRVPKLNWALTQTHGCVRNLICIKQCALKQPGGVSKDFVPWGRHGTAFSGFTVPHIIVTAHENKHAKLTSTQIAYSLLVLKLSVILSLFSFNTFIFMVTVELGYISLYLSPPCSCCIHTSLYKQCSVGLRPACSVAQMWWMAARGWHCLLMDGGGKYANGLLF